MIPICHDSQVLKLVRFLVRKMLVLCTKHLTSHRRHREHVRDLLKNNKSISSVHVGTILLETLREYACKAVMKRFDFRFELGVFHRPFLLESRT